MKRAAIAAICLSAFLLLVGNACAAQRYASPGGKGTACFQNAPCSLNTALEKAKTGDEVIVGPGVHQLTKPAEPEYGTTGLYVHGDPAGPMPTVIGAEDQFGLLLWGGSTLRYLSVQATGFQVTGVFCTNGDLLDQVVVTTPGVEPIAVILDDDCSVRNSLVRASGEDAIAILARPSFEDHTGPVQNVTAIATGVHSAAIASRGNSPSMGGDYVVDVVNTIAAGDENDIRAGDSSFGRAHIEVTHSNFDVASSGNFTFVKDKGGNQGLAPLFVDAAGGDFREAAGSPTIDSGLLGDAGPLDLAGASRIQGSAPDIGAFEANVPTSPAAGTLRSLEIGPRKFQSITVGDSTGGGILKSKPPVRTAVTFSLSAPASVAFSVERRLSGRRVGRKCVKPSAANKGKRTCPRFAPVKGGFAVDGAAGDGRFTFTGKVGGRALKRGRYRLVGKAGGAVKRAPFQIAAVFRPAPK